MAIRRYHSHRDNVISNAFRSDLLTRATGSNIGAADVLETFSIYGQSHVSSSELARILIEFPSSQFSTDRTAGTIPASGSISWYLKLFNAKHSLTLAKNFHLQVQPISGSWTEGTGLDLDEYKDIGKSNWISSSISSSWVSQGGDVYSTPRYSQHFAVGNENLEIDISSTVESWLNGTRVNHGMMIRLSASHEVDTKSFFTKRFFGRTSEFFLLRPVIEARWNSTKQDDRGNFYYSSSLATADDNLNTLYLYNSIRGRFRNIPSIGTGLLHVSLYSGSTTPSGSALVLSNGLTAVTGGWSATGIYTASMALTASTTPLTKIFDVWFSGSNQFFTGSIIPQSFNASWPYPIDKFVTKITNLKAGYTRDEEPQMRVFIRQKNWNPTIYTRATANIKPYIMEQAFYRVLRLADNFEVVSYGTGSLLHTQLSYDVSGNYFPLDMALFEEDFMYGVKFAYNLGNGYEEQPEIFKFRIEKTDAFNN